MPTPPIREVDRPTYPGLNFVSTQLWREWLLIYESAFQRFEYNVRIGQGLRAPAGATEAEAKMWKYLTQKRIDVVAFRPGQTWIIEIEERPGARTYGQLNLYFLMADEYLAVQGKKINALICRRLGYDMFKAFRASDAIIFKFAPGYPPALPPSFPPPNVGTEFQNIAESYGHPAVRPNE